MKSQFDKATGNRLTRRDFALATGAAISGLVFGVSPQSASAQLRGSYNVPWGIAVETEPFRKDADYRQAIAKNAGLIAPMNALKWADIRYDRNKFDFERGDLIVDFARERGLRVHGHALLWYHANPDWVSGMSSAREAEKVLVEHIEKVAGHYAGRVHTWDVVNEVIAHDPLSEGPWRKGIWYDLLGPEHVDIAFRAAFRADPGAKFYINDYDLEDPSPRQKERQAAMLSIVRHLQDRNIPVHGVGLQAHLYAERQTGRDNLVAFVRELKKLGIAVAVTELDIIDWKLSKNTVKRDQAVAGTALEFLEALYSAATPEFLTTWGLSDRYSWVSETFPRKDNGEARPLPLDRELRQKPLYDVIRRFTA